MAFVPVLASMLIVVSTCISLVTIVSVYREGGILKRLRATPLRPITILSAHVLTKLLFTLVTVLLLVAAGRRYYPADASFPGADGLPRQNGHSTQTTNTKSMASSAQLSAKWRSAS